MNSLVEITPSPEEETAPTTIPQLRELLHDPDTAEELNLQLAQRIQARLRQYLGEDTPTEPQPLDEQQFTRIYNPHAPTIAVDGLHTFSGTELVAAAAHQTGRANVVHIVSASSDAAIVHGTLGQRSQLQVARGVLITGDGQAWFGVFPQPIRADALETVDDTLADQCAAAGAPTLRDPNVRHFRNKANLLQQLDNHGTAVTPPRRISEAELYSRPSLDNIVIKPASQGQGSGVLITQEGANPEQARRTYQFLAHHGYEPLIEERVRSWPFYDPNTHERLDWNVRAIVHNGKLVDMYIRAGAWDQPVNLSQSARTLQLKDIPAYVRDPQAAAAIPMLLQQAANAIGAQYPSSLLGPDLTIDEAGSARVFEINDGRVGGLQTMAMLHTDRSEKLRGATAVLDGWLDRLPPEPAAQPASAGTVEPLEPCLVSILTSAEQASHVPSIANIPAADIAAHNDAPAAILWGFAAREQAMDIYDPSARHTVETWMMQTYPLEMQRFLPYIIDSPMDVPHCQGFIQEGEALFPNSKTWPLLHAGLETDAARLHLAAENIREALRRGASVETCVQAIEHQLIDQVSPWLILENDPARQPMARQATHTFATFCASGYEAAVQHMEGWEDIQHEDMADIRTNMRILLAVLDQRFDTARALLATDDIRQSPFVTDRLLGEMWPLYHQSPEAMTFFVEQSCATGYFLRAVLESVAYAKAATSAEGDIILQTIGRRLPLKGTSAQRDRFVDVLRAEAGQAPRADIAIPEKPPAKSASEIRSFTWVLHRLFQHNPAGVSPVIQRLDSGRLRSSNFEHLAALFVDP